MRKRCQWVVALVLVLLALPAAVQSSDYTYTTNNDGAALTITSYTGPGGDVSTPDTLPDTNGLPVTAIGDGAFQFYESLTSLKIGTNVTSIGAGAFAGCTGLSYLNIPNNVTTIADAAFEYCTALTDVLLGTNTAAIGAEVFYNCYGLLNIFIPRSVIGIGDQAFVGCFALGAIAVDELNPFYSSLDGVLFNQNQNTLIQYPGGKAGTYTVPGSVTSVGDQAFAYSQLTEVYFRSNAPGLGSDVFYGTFDGLIVYYLPGTSGWSTNFGDPPRPTALWRPQIETGDATFGLRTNQFGFNIVWASGMKVVVDASANLVIPAWLPLQTNTLTADTSYFSDPSWTNSPRRYYRLRWP